MSIDRAVWVRVASGVESLSEKGNRVWADPAHVRKALRELLSVVPITHAQIDLAPVLRACGRAEDWGGFFKPDPQWAELLAELALAVGSAAHPATWGLGLPDPTRVAQALGDETERGLVKAGLQLASALQRFRQASLGFVSIAITRQEEGRAIGPVLRNAQMYGWARAVTVPTLAVLQNQGSNADFTLVEEMDVAEVLPRWVEGEAMGGGLGSFFWNDQRAEIVMPERFLLYGTIPSGISPQTIVQAGRKLRSWLSSSAHSPA